MNVYQENKLLILDLFVYVLKPIYTQLTLFFLVNMSQFIYLNCHIGLVGSVFANGPEDLGSIPGRVIPKTLKMVLNTSLLNTQQC